MPAADQMLFSYMAAKNAKYHPFKTFLVQGDTRLSFGDFEDRTNRLARGLGQRGVTPGDRVCILNHNAIANAIGFFGAMKAGGVFCPVNARLAGPEVAAVLADAEPKLVLAGAPYLDKLAGVPGLEPGVNLFVIGGEDPASAYDSLLAGQESTRLETPRQDSDLAALIYTSGTTGKPKGVMWTHRNLFSSAQASAICRRTRPEDVALVAAPIYQAAGVGTLFSSTFRGNTVVLLDKFDPHAYLATIAREKVTTAFVVPAMVLMLLEAAEERDYDLTSLRTICYGSAPMPPATLKRAMARFAWRFMGACGATETAPGYIAFLPHQDHLLDGSPEMETRLASIGKESINVEARIFDLDDQELPPGQVGEIVVRGSNVMAGYWRKPEETAQALRGGWYHSGDLGFVDEEGYIFLVDRKSQVIISGGFNIYPKEIEEALTALPGVLEAAVVGVPHERWGETPAAYVVSRPHADPPAPAELMEMLRQRLAGFKLPRGGIFLVDQLPRNASGKVIKRELKKFHAAQAQAGEVHDD